MRTTFFLASPARTAALTPAAARALNGHLSSAALQQLDSRVLLWRQRPRRALQDHEAVVADAFRIQHAIADGDETRTAKPVDGSARRTHVRKEHRDRQWPLAQLADDLQIGFDDPAARQSGFDHRLVSGEDGIALAATGHVRRQRHAQHLPDRRDVVLGGPAAEIDDLGREGGLFVVENGADGLEPGGIDSRCVRQADHEPGGSLFAPNGTSTRAPSRTASRNGLGMEYVYVPCTATGIATSAKAEIPWGIDWAGA